ncbi:MAG TPA: amino acid adenylation domain-containing protein, partial [Blastocatellia bacterium]|nr:amino acid adenylation domain-containing protein [Blastocatellia bacterium]
LEQGPLLRASIWSLPDRRLLVLTLPALCADLLTLDRLAAELNRWLSSSEVDDPADEPIQYLQFSEWQNELLEESVWAEAGRYWGWFDPERLSDLELPFARRAVPAGPFDPRSITAELDSEQAGRLEATADRLDVSTGAILLAGLSGLIGRLTENPNPIIGHGCDGRGLEEVQETAGPFAGFLPLPGRLPGWSEDDESFADLARRLDRTRIEDCRQQHYFSWESPKSRATSDRKQPPFFPLCFDLRPRPDREPGGPLSIEGSSSSGERFELGLFGLRHDLGLRLTFDYDPRRLAAEEVQRLMGYLRTLLDEALRTPQVAVTALNLLGPDERRQVLVEFNETAASAPPNGCLHELIEAQAERRPEAVAVIDADRSLTYGELSERSNRLADFLRRSGVGPEVPVAIRLDRSLEMMVGILGILKAGGAYVPLNPDLPSERLAFVIRDAGAALLLTHSRLRSHFEGAGCRTVALDADWETIAPANEAHPAPPAGLDHLAYLIYTSGSTGRPKGVMVTHRNLAASNQARHLYYREPVTGFMLVSPFSFDSSIAGIFWTLSQGGTLALAANDFHQDLTRFIYSIADHRLSHLLCIPSFYEALLQHPERAWLGCLKAVIVAGESCSAALVARHREVLPHVPLFNEYGPTECTVWSSVSRVDSGDSIGGDRPPIGRPIANNRIYLLDSRLNPVPVGFPGEIYIGGAGVSRGYAGLPELTAEKFIPDPFSVEPGARLYRTGDRGRYLANGEIDFLGRVDHQVKIRGYRIELEEIESVLRQCPEVRHAVVAVEHSTTPEELPRLVAYLVPASPRADRKGLIGELRRALAGRLPAPMIPGSFIVMESLPLTPNGKVDRRALPAAGEARSALSIREGPGQAPQGELEELLAGIWREILEVERVGRRDNFFELGGDSIKGILLINRMQERLGRQVEVGALLQSANLAEMAGYLATDRTLTPDLRAEAVLDPEIQPAAVWSRPMSETRCIFLTGATGFLGAFLLQALLRRTEAEVWCLVRSRDAEEGRRKLLAALDSYRLGDDRFASRIVPVPGDLAQPRLGLSPEVFQSIAETADLVYHNGASVNFVYPYFLLKPVNVLGTQEALRLASRAKAKPFHYVSTISVFSATGPASVIREDDEPAPPGDDRRLPAGYAQSKWVAERLVMAARARGLPVSIYRPGRIAGDSRTGISNPDDFVCRYLRGCLQLGAMPDWDG